MCPAPLGSATVMSPISHPETLLQPQCHPGPPASCRQVPGRPPGSSRVALFRQRRCQLAAGAVAEHLATAFGSSTDSGTPALAPSPRGANLVPAAFCPRRRQRPADCYCGAELTPTQARTLPSGPKSDFHRHISKTGELWGI